MSPPSPKLFRVHSWDVNQYWPHVEPWIAEALRRSNSDFTTADIKQKIDAGQSRLWVISDDNILAAATTEFVWLKNNRKLCVIGALAGKDMAFWDHTWEQFERYAKQAGCHSIQIVGRPGWVRYMKARGFKQPWAVLEKQL